MSLIDGVNINIYTTDDMMLATRLQLARAARSEAADPSGDVGLPRAGGGDALNR